MKDARLMMEKVKKTLVLDTFLLADIGDDRSLATAVQDFIERENYLLLVGSVHFVELYGHPKCWQGLLSFLGIVDFAIVPNCDKILAGEVNAYPNNFKLPLLFESRSQGWSAEILQGALEINMKEKISAFASDFRPAQQHAYESLVSETEKFRKSCGGKPDKTDEFCFLQSKTMSMMMPEYADFLNRQVSKRPEGLKIQRLRSVYLQVLAVFMEYCQMNKTGKRSDVGDFVLLPYIAYSTLAVLDKERVNLVEHMKKRSDVHDLAECINMKEFRMRLGSN